MELKAKDGITESERHLETKHSYLWLDIARGGFRGLYIKLVSPYLDIYVLIYI